MGFFKKMMASVGIGSAKVDAVLDNNTAIPGEELTGIIKITGGNIEQNIEKVYLRLATRYEKTVEDKEGEEKDISVMEFIKEVSYDIDKTFQPGEEFDLPFAFPLDIDTPMSTKKTPIWLSTGLDVKMALDPTDEDDLEVKAHPYLAVVMEALIEELGFALSEVKNLHRSKRGKYPFVQELELKPKDIFKGDLDELELIYKVEEDRIELVIEVDRKAKGLLGAFMESLELDESNVKLVIGEDEINQGAGFVADLIKELVMRNI